MSGDCINLGGWPPVPLVAVAAVGVQAQIGPAELDRMGLGTGEHVHVVGAAGLALHRTAGVDDLDLDVAVRLELGEGDAASLHRVPLDCAVVEVAVLPPPCVASDGTDVAAAIRSHQTEAELVVVHLVAGAAQAVGRHFFTTQLTGHTPSLRPGS